MVDGNLAVPRRNIDIKSETAVTHERASQFAQVVFRLLLSQGKDSPRVTVTPVHIGIEFDLLAKPDLEARACF
jgi:hypothetical protein